MPQIKSTPVIIFQNPQKFQETVKGFKEVCEFPNYRVKDGVISPKGKVTYGVNTCSVLAMDNGKETYLGHFAPEYMRGDFMTTLDEIVKRFKDATGELKAVILGGYSRLAPPNEQEAKKSFSQLADIGNVLDRHTSHITMIGGKYNPTFVEDVAIQGDKVFVTHKRKIGQYYVPELKASTNSSANELILEKDYEVVDCDGHKIFFEG